ncbi:Uncharacterised protein [Vibrio cholerae]|nr:Uncharacterised protein [Vibrio cholerae]CSD11422.1 Uncharacterised protein [Vibrio cholerae]CSI39880.1 Uncharacterised protein [Vibrio cholerae]
MEQHAHLLTSTIQFAATEGGNIFTIEPDLSLFWQELTADQTQQCGFTDSRRPHNCCHFTFGDMQIYVIKNDALRARKTQIFDGD